MKRIVFISISYSQRAKLGSQIEAIQHLLCEMGYDPIVFVDRYSFADGEDKLMMQQSQQDIERSDFVLAELSDKTAIGVGVEVGFAVGIGKPVVYMRHVDAPASRTVGGVADFSFTYDTTDSLTAQLKRTIGLIHHAPPL